MLSASPSLNVRSIVRDLFHRRYSRFVCISVVTACWTRLIIFVAFTHATLRSPLRRFPLCHDQFCPTVNARLHSVVSLFFFFASTSISVDHLRDSFHHSSRIRVAAIKSAVKRTVRLCFVFALALLPTTRFRVVATITCAIHRLRRRHHHTRDSSSASSPPPARFLLCVAAATRAIHLLHRRRRPRDPSSASSSPPLFARPFSSIIKAFSICCLSVTLSPSI